MKYVALLLAILPALIGCPALTTQIRYEVVGTGTSSVGVIDVQGEHGVVHAGPQTLPWSYDFDSNKAGLFLAVTASNADYSPFTGTVTVRILIDGDVVESNTSSSLAMAMYIWQR